MKLSKCHKYLYAILSSSAAVVTPDCGLLAISSEAHQQFIKKSKWHSAVNVQGNIQHLILILIALSLIQNFLCTAWDRHNRSLHFFNCQSVEELCLGASEDNQSLSLSFCLHTLSEREIQPLRPAKSLLSPFLIACYTLKRQLFPFLSQPY